MCSDYFNLKEIFLKPNEDGVEIFLNLKHKSQEIMAIVLFVNFCQWDLYTSDLLEKSYNNKTKIYFKPILYAGFKT